MSPPLQLEQIQGIVVSGYGDRPSASYVLIEIVDRVRAQRWLATLIPMLQFGEYRATPRDQAPSLNPLCVNIAFTHEGFRALGLGQETLLGFSHAFQEGAAEPSRARRLGDDADSDPRNWVWGQPEQKVHGVLAVFAGAEDAASTDDAAIRAFIDGQLI